ncbi:MAG: aspartate--tRNA(Asn) ligase [Sulfolobales archaeon]
MKKHFTRDILERGVDGERYEIYGWVSRVRDLGGVKFILIRDREGFIQAVAKKGSVSEEVLRIIEKLSREDVVKISGVFRKNSQAPGGGEIIAENIEILSKVVEPPPIEVENSISSDLSTRLRWRWLDARNPKINLIFRVEAAVAMSFREFFVSEGFIEIFTPKIVGGATEGGAEVFPILYFDKHAFLAQSPQFYKQMGVIAGFEKVFEIGPVFRAEKHHTVRHLTEYHSIDYEIGFIRDYNDVMDVAEKAFKHVVEDISESSIGRQAFKEFKIEKPLTPGSFPRVSLRDLYKILENYGKKIQPGEELDAEGEKAVWRYSLDRYNSDFIFVTDYPWKARPFYTMRRNDDPNYTYGFDLLFRGLEVATGSQREHRYEVLLNQLKEKGLNPDNFWFYLEFFKYGAPPHGGAGIGLERVVMQLLGLDNIREARLLPRDPERLFP